MKFQFHSYWRKAVTLFFAFSFSLGVTATKPVEKDYLHGLNGAHFHEFESQVIGRSFGIHVRLPENYEENRLYPTIYLVDGGVLFPMLGAYYRYLNLAGDVPDMIIVGIAYPGNSFPKGNFRGGDFTAPADSAAHYGGAEQFLSFYETELFPMIESTYQAAPDRRMLFGQSLGGQFSLFAAQTRPELFYGAIASNPALHRNLSYFIELPEKQTLALNRPRLFVSLAAEDDERFRIPARRWAEHYANKINAGFTLKVSTIQDHNHFSATPEAFRNGLKWIFGDAE